MKNSDLANSLKKNFIGKQEFTSKEITEALQTHFPDVSSNTIAWRLNQLKKAKLIHQTGRGLYSFDYKPEYSAELSLKSKRLYNRIKSIYTDQIVIWDTIQLSQISGEEIAKYWVFIGINKDNLDFLFNEMLSFSKKVFLQPDRETTARYLVPQEEAIILTPLISEMPTEQVGDYLTLSIEGILVNNLIEYEQYLQPIGININKLYKEAFAKYNVNKSKLLRYAARRDRRKEITELLKAIE